MVTLNGTQLYQALNGLLTAANNGRPVLNESAAFEDLDEFIDGLEVAQNAKVTNMCFSPPPSEQKSLVG